MKRQLWTAGLIAVLTLTLVSAALAADIPRGVDNRPAGSNPAVAPPGYETVITVNSGTDPDTSDSRTCLTHSPCTLRRAVVQARNLPAGDRPVLIAFDIPAEPSEGYDADLEIWKIEFSGISSQTNAAVRYLAGRTVIDGTTQPEGRTEGPSIILVGPGDGQWDGIKVGETQFQSENHIRGLGFQNFRTAMYLSSKENVVKDCWFGLNDSGTAPLLRDQNDPSRGSGNTGIAFSATADGNLVTNNYFLGLNGVAAAIRGEDNTFSDNFIGTRSDGRVTEKLTDPDLICTPVDWLGGGGISVADTDNVIHGNLFAGIRLPVSQFSLQGDTIRVSGQRHEITDNVIGGDLDDETIGVCGRGIYLTDSPKNLLVQKNQIIDPQLSAISLNGSLYDGTTLRTNMITKTSPWPQVDDNPEPEDAIQLGPGLPAAFREFQPARVTTIDETSVEGTSGNDSPCPNCVIELFLDDADGIVQALSSLAVVTADAGGNWTAVLSQPLDDGQGIRTTSTTAQYNTIPNISAGTTTGLSQLYTLQPDAHRIFLPLTVRQ